MMRKVLLTAVFILTATILFAQNNLQDVVYLRNGSIIRGTITEQVPNQSLTIATADGSLFVLAMDEVERITREPSQRPVLEERRFGVMGGLNVASQMVSGAETGMTDSRLGVHLGFFMEMPLGTNWTFRPALLYSQQGATTRAERGIVTEQLDYIIVPLDFRWHFWDQRMSLDFGPQFGYMIRAKLVGGGETSDVMDIVNRFDFSIVFGVSFRLTDNICLGIRATAGVTDIIEVNNKRWTNSVSQLSVAVRL